MNRLSISCSNFQLAKKKDFANTCQKREERQAEQFLAKVSSIAYTFTYFLKVSNKRTGPNKGTSGRFTRNNKHTGPNNHTGWKI